MVSSALTDKLLKPLRVHFSAEYKEIIMNKPCEIYIERARGGWEVVKDKELNYSWFKSMANHMCVTNGQNFTPETSMASFKLPEGHRVQIISGDSTRDKFAMAIRLNRGIIFDINDYEIGSEEKEKIIQHVKDKKNILVSGGTQTGKTSFLNSLINHYVERDSRLVTIEGVPELVIKHHKNVTPLFYKENEKDTDDNASELLNASLRLRPDRIILGELRKENCFVFARAINTGHDGSMATIHANSPEDAISAIKENIIMNGDAAEGALTILDNQLRRNIHGVIQLEKIKGGKVRGYFRSFSHG